MVGALNRRGATTRAKRPSTPNEKKEKVSRPKSFTTTTGGRGDKYELNAQRIGRGRARRERLPYLVNKKPVRGKPNTKKRNNPNEETQNG